MGGSENTQSERIVVMDLMRLVEAIMIALICLCIFFLALLIVSKLSWAGVFVCSVFIGIVFIIYKKLE